MRKTIPFLSLLLLSGIALAVQVNESLHKHTVGELRAKIERTKERDRGELYAELAHALVEEVNTEYSANDFAKANTTLKEVLDLAQKATDLALANEKHIKRVEIELRETARRLNEIKRSLSIEDQPPVTEVADKIEKMRLALFDTMFGDKKKK